MRENISGVRVVRAFCQEDAEMATFDVMNRDFVEKNRGLIWITSFLWPAMGLMYAVAVYDGPGRGRTARGAGE